MAKVEYLNFGGIDLRSNNLLRPNNKASDAKNVCLDHGKNLIKRFGFDLKDNTASNYKDIVYYGEGDKLICVDAAGIREWNTVTENWDAIKFHGATGQPYTVPCSFAEYNGVLYIADPALNNWIMKYDGNAFYRAGMPGLPETLPGWLTVAVGGGSTMYFRFAYRLRDSKGNVIWGDYTQDSLAACNSANAVVPPLSSLQQFPNVKGVTSGANTLNGGTPTSTINFSSHNFTVGDTYWYNIDGIDYPLEVLATTATTVDFNTSDYPNTTAVAASTIFSLVKMAVFTSRNETFGYTLDKIYDVDMVGGTTISNIVYSPNSESIENFYDTTVLKGLPPKAKYISMYNNVMVAANAIEEDASGGFSVGEAENYERPNTFYWSDTGVGSTVETFPPFYNQSIGKTEEGPITGVYADTDRVLLFKTRHGYIINGLLVSRNYRINRFKTTGIGCVSHKSITEVDGGCFFLSERGVYLLQYGDRPMEVSDIIEPAFTEDSLSLEFENSRGALDVKRERFYLYVPSSVAGNDRIFVYSYYHKEWFVYDGYDATSGFLLYNNDIFHNDGTNTYQENNTYNDNNVAIDAYYKTAWNNRGNPSMTSKFINAILYSLGTLNWSCGVKTEIDWIEDVDTDETIDFDSDVRFDQHNLNNNQAYSMRFTFSNAIKNQGMYLTGAEIVVEDTQRKAKVYGN
jgi:hypothetical protein